MEGCPRSIKRYKEVTFDDDDEDDGDDDMEKKALKQGPCYQYMLHALSVKSVLMFINQCIGLRLKGPNSQTVELQTSNTLASGSHYQKCQNPKITSPHQPVFTWWGGWGLREREEVIANHYDMIILSIA